MSISTERVLAVLRRGFVASCQPIDNGPMDTPEIVAAMAQAAISGGAVALRIEGIDNLKAVRDKVDVPIIGIIKRDLSGSDVRITPFTEDVVALASAGADIIAIDATDRVRPEPVLLLVNAIHDAGCLVMADCSTYSEGIASRELGVDIIGSTLSGYICGDVPDTPDFDLVTQLSNAGCFVMAEGRYNTPELAKKAIEAGAASVTVGSAITRIEHICGWFTDEIRKAHTASNEDFV